MASHAEKHTSPRTKSAFTFDGDGKELVTLSTRSAGLSLSYALFGKKIDCDNLVEKVRQSRKYQYSSLDFEKLERAFCPQFAQYNDPNSLVVCRLFGLHSRVLHCMPESGSIFST